MKSLDEQIKYMREEASYYEVRSSKNELMRSIFVGNLENCQAILDTLLQLKGKARDWNGCFHEWEEVESQASNEKTTAVRCVKCRCSGERQINSAEVFWPAT